MISPPTKKPTTAFNDGICRLLMPDIAWPEVQPPAYRLPKPISTPPMVNIKIILGDCKASFPKRFSGSNRPKGASKPSFCNSETVSGLTDVGKVQRIKQDLNGADAVKVSIFLSVQLQKKCKIDSSKLQNFAILNPAT